MRMAISACVVVCALAAAPAVAQVDELQQRSAVLLAARGHILDGVWHVGGFGRLTLTTRDGGSLEGELDGRPCHGQYLNASFSVFCESDRRGPVLLTGWAVETPPVATTARARVAASPARMLGQIHQAYLDGRGHAEELGEFTATRQ